MLKNKKGEVSFGAIVATIGAILIAVGVAWLIALNWHAMPDPLKILILVLATASSYFTGVVLRTKEHDKIGSSLLVLGALLYTLSIFLIAQIFSTSTSIQGVAFLLLLAWVGVVIASYLFDSQASLLIALVEFLVWISLQFIAFEIKSSSNDLSIGMFALTYLVVGVMLYGLNLAHKAHNHKFSLTYRFWTAFYILVFTYILSFQILIPILWPKNLQISMGAIIFLMILTTVALISFVVGVFKANETKKITGKEVFSFLGLVGAYIILISLASLVSGESANPFQGGDIGAGLWFLWVLNNVVFILVILSVIGYGTRYKSSSIVNVAILFFALDIVTRYIGFIMDFGGYNSFAIVSITGGIILIFGGWFIEKWREKLIAKTKAKVETGYSIY